jgi:hypothetical protein
MKLCIVKVYLRHKINYNIISLLIVLIPLLIPNVNFAQSPNLGKTSSFALFTAAGQFSNIGATSVTGDIGTNSGAFSGFPPGIVVGQIHVIDTASAQAAIDANTLYSFLSSITCDSVIGTTLGRGQILTPNVYCMGAVSTLDGKLTLDAQGNVNAIFIFRIGGAFSTSALSNISLINSASLSNVYWQIDGEVDLGSGSDFQGTIVADGAINLAFGASLEGRALSIAGAISLNDNRVSLPSGSNGSLPIQLLSFTASGENGSIHLLWSTASEIDNNYFSIERSQDAISFEEILRMTGAGNSNTTLYYSAIDYDPYNGTAYYRLKQTDFDGKYTYSNIVAVDFEKSFTFSIYPNPFIATSLITIKCVYETKNAKLWVYNTFGEIMTNIPLTGPLTILKTVNLPSGIYFYRLIDNDKIIQSGKLVSK